MILVIGLRDKQLFNTTVCEYASTFEAEAEACYDCDEHPGLCPRHQARLKELSDNLTALAYGMLYVSIEVSSGARAPER